MKNNGMVIVLLAYLAIFGIKVDKGALEPIRPKDCIKLVAPTTVNKDPLPNISKENRDNKDYVIKVLIRHISNQNDKLDLADKKIQDMYKTYNKCV